MAEVAILDVGHGNAAVLRAGESAIVVDAGSGTALLEYLDQEGISSVTAVVISHADADHLKGLTALLDQDGIEVGAVYVNSDAAKTSRQWKAVVYALDDRNRNGECEFSVDLTEGLRILLDEHSSIEVLAPRKALAATGPGATDDQGNRITTNTISAVVRLHLPGKTVLLTGDVDRVGLDHMLATDQQLSADVLVFPHHGGHVAASASLTQNSDFADTLLQAVDPSVVIFSIGRTMHMNPRPEIVRAIANSPDRSIMCTQMSRHCFGGSELSSTHLSPVYSAGRHRGHCCAGSIVISAESFAPTTADHGTFVSLNAPTALCRQPDPDADPDQTSSTP